jgi:hypothetical protein
MKYVYQYSKTFAEEAALAKYAQQPARDNQQTMSMLLDNYMKIDPANQKLIALKAKADSKQLTPEEIAGIKEEILKELPVLRQSLDMVAKLVYQLA